MLNLKTSLTAVAVLVLSTTLQAASLGSAFTYQGKLAQNGIEVTGTCDFNFGLYDASVGGTEVVAAIDVLNVQVENGTFTVNLDFGGGVFDGNARWLAIAVACPAGGDLTALAPRQAVTPSPHALYAGEAGALDWSGLLNIPPDIADGDAVNDDDADPTNELQDLELSGNTLSLTGDASPVDLSGFLDNTDDQTLTEVLAQGNDAGGTSISNIATTTTDALTLSGLDCTTHVNGGALTTNASGEVLCSDDDAGGGGGNTLDAAYDQGGAGAGRIITADSGAVSIAGTDGLLLDTGNLLQTPGDPVQVGNLGIGTNPTSVYVSGRYAYVVDAGTDDLKVIDVSDPATPNLAGSLGIGAGPRSVYVSGRYAYVVDTGSHDLKVIDVSDPGAPSLAGSLGLGTTPASVYVSGRYAYVVDAADLKVIDVSDPGTPSLAGSLGIGSFPMSVYVSGRYAYVVNDGSNDLKVIDVSDPATPSLAGSLGIGTRPTSVYVSGRYAYVVDEGTDDLKVIDVSDPATPSLAGSLGLGINPVSVYVSGRYAYVVAVGSGDLHVIDVSDPGTPSLAGSLSIGIPRSVYVSGRYAYVVDSGSRDLKVIDVSGAEVTSLMAHSLEAGNLQVRNDVIAQGQLQVTGGINVGSGGLFSDGDVGVAGTIVAEGTVTGSDGLRVGTASDDGIFIHQAGFNVAWGTNALSNGVEIRSAANDGLMVGANGGDGVDIWNAAENGLYVRVAGNHGLHINSVAQNGIDIVNVGAYGIHIADSDADNFFAGDTGIGVSSPTNRLHVRDSISAAASAGNHVAQIENTSNGGSADVLVLKINELPEDIDGGNNFLSFHGASGSSLGAIQGNSAGSVVYAGTGADYAEYLAKIEPLEVIEPGDILGVHQGRVTRSTENADFLLAASTDALVAGNDPGEEHRDAHVLVSFIGQADLRVSGPVMAGDLIVASGNDDGVGVAINTELLDSQLIGQVVGQAWEANPDPRVKPVRSLVGLIQPQVLAHSLRNLEARLQKIESALDLQ